MIQQWRRKVKGYDESKMSIPHSTAESTSSEKDNESQDWVWKESNTAILKINENYNNISLTTVNMKTSYY